MPKTHWLDAACVGASTPKELKVEGIRPLVITAMGRGSRQICSLRSPTTSSYGRVDKYGFPRTSAKKFKRVQGFQTGDMVKAVVPTGKKAGTYVLLILQKKSKGSVKSTKNVGRVAIRATGNFNIKTGKFERFFGVSVTDTSAKPSATPADKSGTVQGISYRYCQMLHRTDGYTYQKGETAFFVLFLQKKSKGSVKTRRNSSPPDSPFHSESEGVSCRKR